MNIFDEVVRFCLTLGLIFGIVAAGYGLWKCIEAAFSWFCGND